MSRDPVLIVDANWEWRRHLSGELQRMGFASVEAESTRSAEKLIQMSSFAAILLDVGELSSLLDVLSSGGLREETPCVVLTHTRAEELSSVLSRQGVYYLPKMASAQCLELLLNAIDPPQGARAI